jgi:hypothetical protein
MNLFRLVDEPSLAGWQSGLYRVGYGTPVAKQSATMVAAWMAQTHGACQGRPVPWKPAPPPVEQLAKRR